MSRAFVDRVQFITLTKLINSRFLWHPQFQLIYLLHWIMLMEFQYFFLLILWSFYYVWKIWVSIWWSRVFLQLHAYKASFCLFIKTIFTLGHVYMDRQTDGQASCLSSCPSVCLAVNQPCVQDNSSSIILGSPNFHRLCVILISWMSSDFNDLLLWPWRPFFSWPLCTR